MSVRTSRTALLTILGASALLSAACHSSDSSSFAKPSAPLLAATQVAGATAAAATSTPASDSSMGGTSDNHPPAIENAQIQGAGGGGPNDAHPNAGDTLHVVHSESDADGDLLTTKITWTVNGADAGEGDTLAAGAFKKGDNIGAQVEVTDSKGATTSRSVTATIRNAAPTFTSVPTTLDGYQPAATDPDGDTVTFEMAPLPGFAMENGAVKMTDPSLAAQQKGKTLAITAKDPDGASATQMIVVNL